MFGLLENRFLAKPAPMNELFSLGQTTPENRIFSVCGTLIMIIFLLNRNLDWVAPTEV